MNREKAFTRACLAVAVTAFAWCAWCGYLMLPSPDATKHAIPNDVVAVWTSGDCVTCNPVTDAGVAFCEKYLLGAIQCQ